MNFFGYSNRQEEVDQLVKQIVDNLVEQKRIVDEYNSKYRGTITEMREQIDYLLKKRIAKPTIIKTVTKKFTDVTGPTIINISQTKKLSTTTTPSASSASSTSSASKTESSGSRRLGKILPGSNKTIYMGPNGGMYYIKTNRSSSTKKSRVSQVSRVYLSKAQVAACATSQKHK